MIYRLAIPKWYFNNNQNRSLENILHTHTHTHQAMVFALTFWWELNSVSGEIFCLRKEYILCDCLFLLLYREWLFVCSFELFVCVASVRIVHVSADSISTAIFGFMCCVHSFNCSKCLSHSKQKGKPSHRVA